MAHSATKTAALIAMVFLSALVLASGSRAEDARAQALVDLINSTTGAAAPGDKDAIRAACGSLIVKALDLETMAPRASYDAFGAMNQSQKKAYLDALSARAARDCVSRGKEVAGEKVELAGMRDGKDGETQIGVRRADGQGKTAIWTFESGGTRAIDVTVDGHSLVTNARSQARQILEQSGGDVNRLIQALSR
ncbi:MAG TPA: ABC transporter substrate-binding protein [Rhizobiaceae bacterium]|nr:ABC transporter substrate-binding protein [Rhizobiaceae bacterium]